MLSRLALLKNVPQSPLGAIAIRSLQVTARKDAEDAGCTRPTRNAESGKVKLGFLPEEWFTAMYNKTGVTGPYLFTAGLVTYLCSKEIFVMEHEYYSGISLAIMIIFAAKKFGPGIAAYLDKEVEAQEQEWEDFRKNSVKGFEEHVKSEKEEQWRAEGQLLIYPAKKENVALQLEACYRERLMNVYSEVKRRLDYQVEIQAAQRRLEQRHMARWIVENVRKAITPQQEKEALQQCINDLKGLAAKA